MDADLLSGLKRYGELIKLNPNISAAPLIPLMFRLRGAPMSISDRFFPHEPIFRLGTQPRRSIIKSGRQCGKSAGIAVRGILLAALYKYFNIAYAFPQSTQAEFFSNNYFRPIMNGSIFGKHCVGRDAVMQRDFQSGSSVFFKYIGDSAERARGVDASCIMADELQGHDLDCLDVLLACMGASPYKFVHYTGTPKTNDNPMQTMWDQSSQAEWVIPCQACNKENICNTANDLLKMLDDTTIVCANPECRRPLDSSLGYYVHEHPSRQLSFPGYHMPQCVFPMHYDHKISWAVLMDAWKNKPKFYFYNEILGESYDAGTKLITAAELRAAATIVPQKPDAFESGRYQVSAIGIDWGGKGKETTKDAQEFISNTACALGGIDGSGIIDIVYLARTPYSMDYGAEARLMQEFAGQAQVDFIASDNAGAGDLREYVLRAAGVPPEKIVPFTYSVMSINKPIVFWETPTDTANMRGARSSYTLDKTRSLTLVIEGIRRKKIRLPDYEQFKDELSDFFALYEESREKPTGGQHRLIRRQSKRTDDIVHAINFCCMALYYRTGMWPDFAEDLLGGITAP